MACVQACDVVGRAGGLILCAGALLETVMGGGGLEDMKRENEGL